MATIPFDAVLFCGLDTATDCMDGNDLRNPRRQGVDRFFELVDRRKILRAQYFDHRGVGLSGDRSDLSIRNGAEPLLCRVMNLTHPE